MNVKAKEVPSKVLGTSLTGSESYKRSTRLKFVDGAGIRRIEEIG